MQKNKSKIPVSGSKYLMTVDVFLFELFTVLDRKIGYNIFIIRVLGLT